MSATWKYIKKKLVDSSTIRKSVYPFNVPQTAKPPYISFFLADLEPLHSMDPVTKTKLENWTIITSDIDVKDAIVNADAIVTLFSHNLANTAEGVTVKQSIWTGRSIPLIEEDEHSDKIYQVIDSFEFRI
jgi:hypothetical protein